LNNGPTPVKISVSFSSILWDYDYGAPLYYPRGNQMATYVVTITNPSKETEEITIEQESVGMAIAEAEYYSRRHGLALVHETSSNVEIARFLFGSKEY
jgi:hypothetical protein